MNNLKLKLRDVIPSRKKDSVRFLFGDIICNYVDLMYSLWYGFTEANTKTFLYTAMKEFIKLPKINRKKFRLHILVRIELIGDTILEENKGLRNLENKKFSMNFNYQLDIRDLRNTIQKRTELLKDFMNFVAEKAAANDEIKSSEIVRFSEIVLQISYKVNLKK